MFIIKELHSINVMAPVWFDGGVCIPLSGSGLSVIHLNIPTNISKTRAVKLSSSGNSMHEECSKYMIKVG